MVTAHAQTYWSNHATTEALLDQYRTSAAEPHRDWAMTGLADLGAVQTVLEIGCHCGPLLARMTQAGMEAYGLDINATAILAAQAAGLRALVGTVPGALARYSARRFDAVISSFCLAYIGPEQLLLTLAELLRISRLGLVIIEPMAGPGVPAGIDTQGSYIEWRHDYFPALDAAATALWMRVEMTRTARGPYAGINGVVTVKHTWRP